MRMPGSVNPDPRAHSRYLDQPPSGEFVMKRISLVAAAALLFAGAQLHAQSASSAVRQDTGKKAVQAGKATAKMEAKKAEKAAAGATGAAKAADKAADAAKMDAKIATKAAAKADTAAGIKPKKASAKKSKKASAMKKDSTKSKP